MVTIVMPIYNTGAYLKESIESILNQTYTNFELICIDDNSNDVMTLELLAYYKNIDERIHMIHLQKNVGAAEARNIGLRNAKGEFIIFLDADDVFDADMIEKMRNCLATSGAEVCVCGHRIYSEESKNIVIERHLRSALGITDRVFSLKELGDEGLLYWDAVPWNKMCKTEFIRKNNIFFQNLSCCNDVFYASICCLSAKSIVYCNEGKPILTYRTKSDNQISVNRIPMNLWYATELILKKESVCGDELGRHQVICSLLLRMIYELNCSSDEKIKKESYDVVKGILNDYNLGLSFQNRRCSVYADYFTKCEYESKWFEKVGNFECQIEEFGNVIDNCLANRNAVVWGNGKRGQAFQRYCKKKGLQNLRVADHKNDEIGTYTAEGFWVISTDVALEEADVIIASNYRVYMDLSNMEKTKKMDIINLEDFCPLA